MDINDARIALKKYYGHDSFREGQEKIINSLISGRDAVGIMPTGAGKSVCYQIPALLADGITLVISPLISLMKDQVSSLIQAGIRGAYYNSSLTEGQCRKALANMAAGMYKIIYVAPERLEYDSFVNICSGLNISYVAIDEAHCVSQWGQDFRPSYLKIADFIDKLPSRPVVGAFTATATAAVRDDIVRMLRLKDPFLLTTGFDRPNLFFDVRRCESKRNRFEELVAILTEKKDKSGIVYCSTRKNVDEIYEALRGMNFNAARYHAGLSDEERHKSQEDFIYDRTPVIIATNAFGMGIDKSNVSFVVHYNMPKNLESYYQEAGRAGRDGAQAECVLLYMPSDVFTIKYLIDNSAPNDELTAEQQEAIRRKDIQRMNAMIGYCNTSGCLRNYMLGYFGERHSEGCGACSGCIERELRARKPLPLKKQAAKSGKTVIRSADETEKLFSALKSMRLRLAREQSLPPYIVFSDSTLKDICRVKPLTEERLLDVNGIGKQKAEKYGRAVIETVSRVLAEERREKSGKTKEELIEAEYLSGVPVHEIARRHRLSVGMIQYIIKHI